MGLHAVKILGITITTSSKKDILEYMEKSLGKPLVIVTPNAEQIVLAHTDSTFKKLLNRADIAIPDGFPVARLLHIPRIPGVELMEDLIAIAVKRRIGVALIGGYGNVAVNAFECLSRRWPGLRGWGLALPAIQLDKLDQLDELVKFVSNKIQTTGVGMVFVGLGAPKQEYFIDRLARRTPAIYMSVGGSFDIISGRTPRAPGFLRTLGLEWLWRLVREPWRISRQLALIKFVWLVLRERYITI